MTPRDRARAFLRVQGLPVTGANIDALERCIVGAENDVLEQARLRVRAMPRIVECATHEDVVGAIETGIGLLKRELPPEPA